MSSFTCRALPPPCKATRELAKLLRRPSRPSSRTALARRTQGPIARVARSPPPSQARRNHPVDNMYKLVEVSIKPRGIFDWCEHFPSTHVTRRFPAGRVDTKLGRFHHGVDGAQNRGVAFDSLEDVGLAAPGVEVVGTTKPPARSHDLM